MAEGSTVLQQIWITPDAHLTNEDRSGMDTEPDITGTTWVTEPTENDWQRLKPVIQELYRDNTLEEVMNKLKREHGFKARYVTWPQASIDVRKPIHIGQYQNVERPKTQMGNKQKHQKRRDGGHYS